MLATVLVLLLPVSGWAEGWPDRERSVFPPFRYNPRCFLRGAEVSCVNHAYDTREGTWPTATPDDSQPVSLSCYQRMQEAMRDMDRYIASKALPTIKADALSMYARWDATMAECMRGK